MSRLAAVAALLLALSGCGQAPSAGPTVVETIDGQRITPSSLPACPTEDSDECWWNADTMGNGQGRSFINVHGVTYYLP